TELRCSPPAIWSLPSVAANGPKRPSLPPHSVSISGRMLRSETTNMELPAAPRTTRRRRFAEYVGMIAALGLLILFFSILRPHFFSRVTFTFLANQIPPLTVIAVGMTFVLVIAGIDLSVGSVLALSAGLLGVALTNWGMPLPVAALLCLAVGLAAGVTNGFITVRWAIPSFIVTLGMLEIAR